MSEAREPEEIAKRIVNEAIPIPTGTCGYAADAHPRLTAVIASAIAAEREQTAQWRQACELAQEDYQQMYARAEKAEAERDEAVKHLRNWMKWCEQLRPGDEHPFDHWKAAHDFLSLIPKQEPESNG